MNMGTKLTFFCLFVQHLDICWRPCFTVPAPRNTFLDYVDKLSCFATSLVKLSGIIFRFLTLSVWKNTGGLCLRIGRWGRHFFRRARKHKTAGGNCVMRSCVITFLDGKQRDREEVTGPRSAMGRLGLKYKCGKDILFFSVPVQTNSRTHDASTSNHKSLGHQGTTKHVSHLTNSVTQ